MEALAVSDEGQLVGFAFVHIAADGSGTFAVAIIARHRRRGLGAAAFRALARYLRDAGADGFADAA
jgi:GNAT superfamily N-acetyltransferase